MPELDGLAATRELLSEGPVRQHVPKILILTTFDVDDYVDEALSAGASGFLLKDTRRSSWSKRFARWRRESRSWPRR